MSIEELIKMSEIITNLYSDISLNQNTSGMVDVQLTLDEISIITIALCEKIQRAVRFMDE